jgi:pyruvate/2-oxoglutarate dehydrogenase complex dihydrolipoamide dehydrogenase (E3) component
LLEAFEGLPQLAIASRATYDETTRPIIDGRTRGFRKLLIDRSTRRLLGCHIVGERAAGNRRLWDNALIRTH